MMWQTYAILVLLVVLALLILLYNHTFGRSWSIMPLTWTPVRTFAQSAPRSPFPILHELDEIEWEWPCVTCSHNA